MFCMGQIFLQIMFHNISPLCLQNMYFFFPHSSSLEFHVSPTYLLLLVLLQPFLLMQSKLFTLFFCLKCFKSLCTLTSYGISKKTKFSCGEISTYCSACLLMVHFEKCLCQSSDVVFQFLFSIFYIKYCNWSYGTTDPQTHEVIQDSSQP